MPHHAVSKLKYPLAILTHELRQGGFTAPRPEPYHVYDFPEGEVRGFRFEVPLKFLLGGDWREWF